VEFDCHFNLITNTHSRASSPLNESFYINTTRRDGPSTAGNKFVEVIYIVIRTDCC